MADLDPDRRKLGRLLSLVYFFAAWGDRMWEFSVVVFLIEVFPGTLLPPSLFGLAENAAGLAFGNVVGTFIDSSQRLTTMRTSIVGQNTSIALVSALFAVVLRDPSAHSMEVKLTLMGFILVGGMTAKLSASMNKICIHKVWAVALASGDRAHQSRLNSQLRRVDLSCSILAPLAVGALSTVAGSSITCLLIALWSFASSFLEWMMAGWLFKRVGSLATIAAVLTKQRKGTDDQMDWFSRQRHNFSLYFSHRCFWVSLPYCILYMSTLSFGGIMVSYLRTLGVENVFLATGRGIAAFVAIGATFAVPFMVECNGLVSTGTRTMWAQVLCLTPLAISFIVVRDHESQRQPWFILLTFSSVCLSRFGLWGFDLAQTHMMQELVDLDRAGAINGAQEVLINVFFIGSFVQTIIFSDPTIFIAPALISFSAISLAALLFTIHGESIKEYLAAMSTRVSSQMEDPRHADVVEELPCDLH